MCLRDEVTFQAFNSKRSRRFFERSRTFAHARSVKATPPPDPKLPAPTMFLGTIGLLQHGYREGARGARNRSHSSPGVWDHPLGNVPRSAIRQCPVSFEVRDETSATCRPHHALAVSHTDDVVTSSCLHHELLVTRAFKLLRRCGLSMAAADAALRRFDTRRSRDQGIDVCVVAVKHHERRANCSQPTPIEHRSGKSSARRLLVGVAT